MAKRKTGAAKLSPNQIELNRWCIEMAVRWPVHHDAGLSAGYGGAYPSQGRPTIHQDEDVIGRATKILSWVTSATR